MPETLAAQIREAVSGRRYAQATHLWNAYAAEVSAEIRGGSAARLPEMRELVEWSRVTVTCARSQLMRVYATRLAEMHAAETYGRGAR